VPYGEDSAVLIGLRAICFIGMHLMGMHLTRGTAQKVGTNELDNRRVGHSDSININMIKCRAIGLIVGGGYDDSRSRRKTM
jgi:hypothetical protein